MTALRHLVIAGTLLLGLGAVAQAQSAYPRYLDESYDTTPLLTGRSVYVNRAPSSDYEADHIVMGLRVPNGLRYR